MQEDAALLVAEHDDGGPALMMGIVAVILACGFLAGLAYNPLMATLTFLPGAVIVVVALERALRRDRVRFDRAAGTVVRETRRLGPPLTVELPLEQVRHVRVQRSWVPKGTDRYRLFLGLPDGREVALQTFGTTDEAAARHAAARISDWLAAGKDRPGLPRTP